MRAMLFLAVCVCAGTGLRLEAQDSGRERDLISFGARIGEIKWMLKLTDKSASVLTAERKKKFQELKSDIEVVLNDLEDRVVEKRIAVPAAMRQLGRMENALSGWLAFADEGPDDKRNAVDRGRAGSGSGPIRQRPSGRRYDTRGLCHIPARYALPCRSAARPEGLPREGQRAGRGTAEAVSARPWGRDTTAGHGGHSPW